MHRQIYICPFTSFYCSYLGAPKTAQDEIDWRRLQSHLKREDNSVYKSWTVNTEEAQQLQMQDLKLDKIIKTSTREYKSKYLGSYVRHKKQQTS